MAEQGQLEQVERQIEISIEAAKSAVERKNMMSELIRDKRFVEIFSVGYMEKEPAYLYICCLDLSAGFQYGFNM